MTTPTEVLINVALLERAKLAVAGHPSDLYDKLAALIPADPMAEARDVLVRAMLTVGPGYAQYVREGKYDSAVEVIRTALNKPLADASDDGLAGVWSFDDLNIGQADKQNVSLSTRHIPRPPNLTNAQWYSHASLVCRTFAALSQPRKGDG